MATIAGLNMLLSNNTEGPRPLPTSTPIINDEMKTHLETILCAFISCFSLLGVITNAINIRIFLKQGVLSDSNTLSLFWLAIVDFISCLSMVPMALLPVTIHIGGLPLYINYNIIMMFCFGVPHLIVARIICWTTVYISIERCLCVLIPFKVKRLMRPKTTAISLAVMSLIIFLSQVPYIAVTRMTWQFHGGLNATIAMVSNEGLLGRTITFYTSFLHNTILTNVAFFMVTIATFLLVYKLRVSRKWRKSAAGGKGAVETHASGGQESLQEKRDLEAMKMVTIITVLFLVCLSMSHLPSLCVTLIDGTIPGGVNQNIFYLTYCYKTVFDVINSSLNFFFYKRVSSRYQNTFNLVFGRDTKK